MIIAIEGIDGSGKGTQAKIITDLLRTNGFASQLFSFPYYSETFFGKEVGKYLNGHYGQLNDVPVQFASLLYAGDRFEKKAELLESIKEDGIAVCDRYVPSNLAHQAAKAPIEKQGEIIDWISTLEYKIYGLPKPDLVFLLDISVAKSTELVLKKKKRHYTNEKLDLHEASFNYLDNVRIIFKKLAIQEDWHIIPCENNNQISSVEEITASIMSVIINKIEKIV